MNLADDGGLFHFIFFSCCIRIIGAMDLKFKDFKGGAFFSRILRKCKHLRKLICIREFYRFFNDFLCKWKLRSSSKKFKSFLPPSLVFYPTFLTTSTIQIFENFQKFVLCSLSKKWGKKLVRGAEVRSGWKISTRPGPARPGPARPEQPGVWPGPAICRVDSLSQNFLHKSLFEPTRYRVNTKYKTISFHRSFDTGCTHRINDNLLRWHLSWIDAFGSG